jgi:hypothetical protein
MIESFSFGRIVVDGKTYNDDVKIITGRVVPSWWRRGGHRVDIEDVADVLAAAPEVLVIGKGDPGMMNISEALRDRLHQEGIDLIEERTPSAVATFNRLTAEGRNVCAGFHLSC